MVGTIRLAAVLLVVCSQSLATAQIDATTNTTALTYVSDTEPVAADPSDATDPGPSSLPTNKKKVRGFNKRARGHGLDGDQPTKGSKGGTFRSRTGGIRSMTSGAASKGGGSKSNSKGKATRGSKGPTTTNGENGNDGTTDNNVEDERSSEETQCVESVANATLVTATRRSRVTTYHMELHVIAATTQAGSMRYKLRSALQRQVAPFLTSCHASSPTNMTRVRRLERQRSRHRVLLSGVLNVVFGPLQVMDVRDCPDPTGASGQASCLRAVGNVSVYRQEPMKQSGGGDGSSSNSSLSWQDESDMEFAAALSNRTEGDGALQGVPGLIDVFSCIVTPLRNATQPVPEGSGRTNGTNYSDDPEANNSQQDRSATPSSGISAFAGVLIAIAIMVVLLLAVLVLVRHRRRRNEQHRPFVAVKDGGDSSSTGYDSIDDYGPVAASMKIVGPARDDRKEEVPAPDPPNGDGSDTERQEFVLRSKGFGNEENDHEEPTVEERVIDHEENNQDEDGTSDDDTRDVEIIPVFRLLTALEVNPSEDDQSLMSVVREKRNYE